MRLAAGALALALAVLPAVPVPGGAPSCGAAGRDPAQQRALIEQFGDHLARARARQGLSHISFSRALSAIAEAYAHLLDRHDRFDHVGPDGSTPGTRVEAAGYCYRFVAENLALGTFKDASELFQAWMDSPGHRDAMMHAMPTVYGLASNCPPGRRTGAGYPANSIAGLMEKGGVLEDATLDADPPDGRPEIFVMLLARPC